jgi:hypothetical protein
MANQFNVRFLFVVGMILTVLVLIDLVLWWMVSSGSSGVFQDTVTRYLNYYPEYCRNASLLTIISIVLGLSASICFLRIADMQTGIVKNMANALAVLNLISLLLHAFSLM